SRIPTVVSLHATKALGIGEGAFVVCTDDAATEAVRQRVNFGFVDSREAVVPAMNAKASEYAAAVGLAALDEWPDARAAYQSIALRYAAAFAAVEGATMQRGYGTEWIAATTIVHLAHGLERVEDTLHEARVASRRWWGDGLARQRAFAEYPREALPVTERLASTTIGLPCWPDLPFETVDWIAGVAGAACGRAPASRAG
ncbi:MAG: hypothetical protein QOD51_1183, partial [Candidatus Eremiobacteraeota bacterium]|nr:hypothetical protein [Candidatus Eremiobacteraeota bacterium]